jgi:hypothetical protein
VTLKLRTKAERLVKCNVSKCLREEERVKCAIIVMIKGVWEE